MDYFHRWEVVMVRIGFDGAAAPSGLLETGTHHLALPEASLRSASLGGGRIREVRKVGKHGKATTPGIELFERQGDAF